MSPSTVENDEWISDKQAQPCDSFVHQNNNSLHLHFCEQLILTLHLITKWVDSGALLTYQQADY